MKFRSLLGFCAILLVTAIEAAGARDPQTGLMLPVELSDEGYIQVTESAFPVRIPKTETVYDIGDSVPLIQKNQQYFIGLAQYDDGYKELLAIRRVLHDGQGTAWVTEQKDLIFGTEMRSETGLFYLRPSETLPIVAETESSYRVLCERTDYTFALEVPKDTAGLTFLEELPDYMAKRVQQMERMKQRVVLTTPASGSLLDLATTDLEADSLSLDPLARMLKDSKPKPVENQNWYEARASEMPPEPEPVIAAPKPKRLPKPKGLRPLRRPAALPPALQDLAVESTPAPSAPEPAPVSAPAPEPAAPAENPAEPVMPLPAEPAPPTMSTPQPVAAPAPPPNPPVAPPTSTPEPTPAAPVEVAPPAPAAPATPAPEPVPVEAAVDPAPPATTPSVEPPAPARSVERADPEQPMSGVARAALRVLLLLVILTLVFLSAIFLLAKFVNRGPRPTLVKTTDEIEQAEPEPEVPEAASPPPLQPKEPEVPIPPEADLPMPVNMPTEIQSTSKPGTFTGSLHGFHISELIQFLNSSKETGTLTISENNNPNQSRVMFEGGEIYNAYYGETIGEAAVAEILRFDDGFFVFSRQVVGGCERVIEQSTMSLLMNVHQALDEATLDPDSFDADLFMLGSAGGSEASEDPQSLVGS